MRIIAGLGNPGPRYAGNRHNIGFMALDAIARRWNAPGWRARFHAEATEVMLGAERVLLMKPQTFMNLSGNAIGEAARFYKLMPPDVIVLHDELDLAPAKLRAKLGGGDAGHNGLRSTTAAIGADYTRVRLGIGHPGDKAKVHGYVLGDFAKAEDTWVEALCAAIADNAPLLASGETATFQNKVHLIMQAKGFADVPVIGKAEAASGAASGETPSKA
ncbi:MAG: aminoacyl-tRNA hydrolase [Bosea sp. (in: a-proteobacteria)]